MDQTGGDGDTTGESLDGLAGWVAAARVDEAIEQRRRAGWLRRQAAEEATFASVLVDLAEHGSPVVIDVAPGRRHRGRIILVGRDVVGLALPDGRSVQVALHAIATVRPQPRSVLISGERRIDPSATLLAELRRHLEHRERLTLVLGGAETVAGTLLAVGSDVVTVGLDVGGVVYVPVWSLTEVSVPESG